MSHTPIGRAEVRCKACSAWNPSGIGFANKEVFETATLTGNRQQCRKCGAMTPCNKENMRWAQSDGKGGFVGKDTTP